MKGASELSGRSRKRPSASDPQSDSSSDANLTDQVANFAVQFRRFGWDILGIGLLALSIMTLLGLMGLTQGALVSLWVSFLRAWLGWGSFLIIALGGIIGLLALWRHFTELPAFNLGRILALEGMCFTLLAVLSIMGGHLIDRADAGLDGGRVGWALAELLNGWLPGPLSMAVLIVLMLLFFMAGFGLFQPLAQQFDAWLLDDPLEEDEELDGYEDEGLLAPEDVEEPLEAPETKGRKRGSRSAGSALTSPPRNTNLPPLNLLLQDRTSRPDEAEHHQTADLIKQTLAEFGIPAEVRGYRVGPTVTQYAVEPGFIEKAGSDGKTSWQKVRVSQISALARDLALALSAERLRIEAPVPGRSFVGIEVPNEHGSMVRLRSILESPEFNKLNSSLSIALGRDVSGLPVAADLARMPHLLVAGTTGSGKSVCIAALTMSLVMNNTPEELRLAMLDPKMVELVRFNGLPHLLGKVETQTERMVGVLRWALAEMDARYRLLESARARDLNSYNKRQQRKKLRTLPRIVILVDELADLMMSAPDQTEHALVRLAQLARATGIHLVVATQRPSTDVLTGLIKANFPARISFTVASSIDSRVILDTNGAETLLGRGDMLFLNPEVGVPQRSQGVLVTDHEVERIIEFWNKLAPTEQSEAPWESLLDDDEDEADKLIDRATEIVRKTQHASASMLQRRLRIGYPRAARLIDELEELGVVGPSLGGGREREVLLPRDDDEENDLMFDSGEAQDDNDE